MKLYYYVNTNAHSLKKEIIHSLLQLNFPKCCLYRNYYFSLRNNLAKLQKIHLVKKKKEAKNKSPKSSIFRDISSQKFQSN